MFSFLISSYTRKHIRRTSTYLATCFILSCNEMTISRYKAFLLGVGVTKEQLDAVHLTNGGYMCLSQKSAGKKTCVRSWQLTAGQNVPKTTQCGLTGIMGAYQIECITSSHFEILSHVSRYSIHFEWKLVARVWRKYIRIWGFFLYTDKNFVPFHFTLERPAGLSLPPSSYLRWDWNET